MATEIREGILSPEEDQSSMWDSIWPVSYYSLPITEMEQ